MPPLRGRFGVGIVVVLVDVFDDEPGGRVSRDAAVVVVAVGDDKTSNVDSDDSDILEA
jgi:hypothetical protein